MFFCLSISGLRGPLGDSWGLLGSSCRILCVLFVFQVRASGDPWGTPGDSWATAVVYCVFFLFVNFGPRGTPGGRLGIPVLQLSGIACSFCLSVSGLRGPYTHQRVTIQLEVRCRRSVDSAAEYSQPFTCNVTTTVETFDCYLKSGGAFDHCSGLSLKVRAQQCSS